MFQHAALPVASTAPAHSKPVQSLLLRGSALGGLAACAILMLCTIAQAQAVRFISSSGDDANDCSRASPCLTLQRGIDRTPINGELQILDTGDYGTDPARITQSITISADGISAVAGGVIIDNVDAVVILRGLHLFGRAANTAGVLISNAAAVRIERCTIEGFANAGIQNDFAGNSTLSIINTVVRDNSADGLSSSLSNTHVIIDNSRFENNGANGMLVGSPAALITRTVVSRNGIHGIHQSGGRMSVSRTSAVANSGIGFAAHSFGHMTLESVVARGNQFGVRVQGGSTAIVSDSEITNNSTGILKMGSAFTRQNNTIHGNQIDISGGVTPLDGL